MSRELDHRALHAEADPEVRNVPLARVADRLDLALDATVAEATGHQDAVETGKMAGDSFALDSLRVDPSDLDRRLVGDAAVGQRLVEALVRVLDLDVLADDTDPASMLGRLDATDDLLPARQIDRALRQTEELHDA